MTLKLLVLLSKGTVPVNPFVSPRPTQARIVLPEILVVMGDVVRPPELLQGKNASVCAPTVGAAIMASLNPRRIVTVNAAKGLKRGSRGRSPHHPTECNRLILMLRLAVG